METAKSLSDYQIKVINAVLTKGNRVELIPTKDDIRVICVRRDEVKGDIAARH